jgi:hypothetical protein
VLLQLAWHCKQKHKLPEDKAPCPPLYPAFPKDMFNLLTAKLGATYSAKNVSQSASYYLNNANNKLIRRWRQTSSYLPLSELEISAS